MKLLRNIFLILCFALIACEDDDLEADVSTVEFSTHHTEKPIENAVNASIVTPAEIEALASFEKEQQRLAALKQEDGGNISDFQRILNNITDPTPPQELNVTENDANVTEIKNKVRVDCAPRTYAENETARVFLMNSTTLTKYLVPKFTNTSVAECVVVLFYSPSCIFSARMAPHYNALARVFPDVLFLAADIDSGNLYIRYGLVYMPNIMLFHNAKPHARFNDTVMNLEHLVTFINKFTGLEHNGTLNVTSADMVGPVPSTIVKKVDYVLILAWAFTLFCFAVGFLKSSICKRMVEFLRNTWHEANAAHAPLHEHED